MVPGQGKWPGHRDKLVIKGVTMPERLGEVRLDQEIL